MSHPPAGGGATLWNKLSLLLVLKIVFGIAAGFVLDVPLRRILPKGLYGGYEGHADEVDCTKNTRNTVAFSWRHCVTRWKFLCSSWCSALSLLIFGFVGQIPPRHFWAVWAFSSP